MLRILGHSVLIDGVSNKVFNLINHIAGHLRTDLMLSDRTAGVWG